MSRVVIIGGGVAGLSCAAYLSNYRKFKITLVDKQSSYIHQLRLHQIFRKDFNQLLYPFQKIATSYGFSFLRAECPIHAQFLADAYQTGQIQINNRSLAFDYLILATGAKSIPIHDSTRHTERVFTLDDWLTAQGIHRFQKIIQQNTKKKKIYFVGGGPTAIQFLFELYDWLSHNKFTFELYLLDRDEDLLSSMPDDVRQYVIEKLKSCYIHYQASTEFISQTETGIRYLTSDGITTDADADMLFLFPGVRPQPYPLATNVYGRLRLEDKLYESIYACGDCSVFEGYGLNSLSAQAAVRKGRLVAHTIRTSHYPGQIKPYRYQALGYFINLGFYDAIGWAFSERTILKGLPAIAMKEVIDKQLESMLIGCNTYIDLN